MRARQPRRSAAGTSGVLNGQALRLCSPWPRGGERPRNSAAYNERLLMRPPRLVFSRFLTYVCGHRATAVFAGGAAISEWIDRPSPPMSSCAAKPRNKIVSCDAQLLCTLHGASATARPSLEERFLAAAANEHRDCWSPPRPIQRSSALREPAFRQAAADGSSQPDDTIAWTPSR